MAAYTVQARPRVRKALRQLDPKIRADVLGVQGPERALCSHCGLVMQLDAVNDGHEVRGVSVDYQQ